MALTLGVCSVSLTSPAAVVQAERAVGERSLSDRAARAVGPPPNQRAADGEGAAGAAAWRGGVVDGDRV